MQFNHIAAVTTTRKPGIQPVNPWANNPSLSTTAYRKLQLSRLIGTARHPNMQKIQIIGFFFENMLHWLWK
jgi:hypothetical protein